MFAALVMALVTALVTSRLTARTTTADTESDTEAPNRVVAIDTIRKLQRSAHYGEFMYMEPACSSHCGTSITKCTDKGYFTDVMYIYWRENDAGKEVCHAFRVPVHAGWVRTLSSSSVGWAAISALSAFQDGRLDPSDIITVGAMWTARIHVNKPVAEVDTVAEGLINNGK